MWVGLCLPSSFSKASASSQTHHTHPALAPTATPVTWVFFRDFC